MSQTRVRALVSGRVQGVWFRESTRRRALELGLGGWVRNLPDGRVEALLLGPDREVRAALEFLHHGPPHASVSQVEIAEDETVASDETQGFRVR